MQALPDYNKPIIRWAGSKRQIVAKLAEFCPDEYLRYVEPFAGSCALFFELLPPAAVLADKNAHLIEAYEVLRQSPSLLHTRLVSLPNSKQFYLSMRSQDISQLSRFQRAVRFLYLNRYCFNGIYRTNLQGEFNVPYSGTGTGQFPPLEHFKRCAELLSSADLRVWDFGTTLRYVRKGDLVYIDPPYAVEARRVFREYGAKTFSSADLGRLSKHLRRIDGRGAHFLLSYADCRESRQLAKVWHSTRIRVRRNIAGFEGARKTSYELIVSNKPLTAKL